MNEQRTKDRQLCKLSTEASAHRDLLARKMMFVQNEAVRALAKFRETGVQSFRIDDKDLGLVEFLSLVARIFDAPTVPARMGLAFSLPEDGLIALLGDIETMTGYLRSVLGDDYPVVPESLRDVRVVSRVVMK